MRRKINKTYRNCLVCGDESTGRHYGVVSCEGCKSFFKRCVRKGSSFVCHDGGACEINQAKRTKCQSCRLKRCMDVGMRQDAVQHKTTSTEKSSKDLIGYYNQGQRLNFINRLLEFEDILNFQPVNQGAFQSLHILNSVLAWCYKVTTLMGLSSYDSRILIGCTWHHVFAVTLIHLDLQSIWTESQRRTSSSGCLLTFLERLKSICSSRIEIMYLRSLLILNPDVPLLTNPVQVDAFQNKLLKLISEEPSSNTGVPLTCIINKLLLILLGTSSCTPRVLEESFFPSIRPSIQTHISEMINNLLTS